METYEFEEIDVPNVACRGPPRKVTPGQVLPYPAAPPLRVFSKQRATHATNSAFQRIPSNWFANPNLIKRAERREATEQEIEQHFLEGDHGNGEPSYLQVKVDDHKVPLSLLKELFLIVCAKRPNGESGEDSLGVYLSVVSELRHCRLQHKVLGPAELLELIECKVEALEQIYECQPSPLQREIEYQAKEETNGLHSKHRVQTPESEGLLDSLTHQSIFDQGDTIRLLKKECGFSCFSERPLSSHAHIEVKESRRSTVAAISSDVLGHLDMAKANEYLSNIEGDSERVQFLREMLSWYCDIQSIMSKK